MMESPGRGDSFLSQPAPPLEAIASGLRRQIRAALGPVAAEDQGALADIVDSHCHLAADAGWVQAAQRLGAKQYCIMSLDQSDWEDIGSKVGDIGVSSSRFRVAFGIHPQCRAPSAEEGDQHWSEDLARRLAQWPSALVGECGLDLRGGYRFTFNTGEQQEVLQRQLECAARAGCAVSLHCLKAHDELLQQLLAAKRQHRLPPAIALHSFNGSAQQARRYVKAVEQEAGCSVFFGFAAWTSLQRKNCKEVLRAIPRNRILLESDWNPGEFSFEGSEPRHCDKVLLNGARILADCLGINIFEAAQLTGRNADLCFSERRPVTSVSNSLMLVTSSHAFDEATMSLDEEALFDAAMGQAEALCLTLVGEFQERTDMATAFLLDMWGRIQLFSLPTPRLKCFCWLRSLWNAGLSPPWQPPTLEAVGAVVKGDEGVGAEDFLAALEAAIPPEKKMWPWLLKTLYDSDVLDEDDILQRYGDEACSDLDEACPRFSAARAFAQPLVRWLRIAEEE